MKTGWVVTILQQSIVLLRVAGKETHRFQFMFQLRNIAVAAKASKLVAIFSEMNAYAAVARKFKTGTWSVHRFPALSVHNEPFGRVGSASWPKSIM
jgi:hypothetical protein